MVVDFVEAKYVHATVMSSHFDVAISGSVPLIHDFDDVYPTLAPIKTSRRGSESRMRLNLNTHVRVVLEINLSECLSAAVTIPSVDHPACPWRPPWLPSS